VAVASTGAYASLHLAPDRQPHQHPTAQFLSPKQQRQSTEGINANNPNAKCENRNDKLEVDSKPESECLHPETHLSTRARARTNTHTHTYTQTDGQVENIMPCLSQRDPTLLVTKIPGLFPDPRRIFPGPCHKPATFKYRDKDNSSY